MSADPTQSSAQLKAALSSWETEGGAGARWLLADSAVPMDYPQSMSTELEHLRVRAIALENMVISLISQATERPRALAAAAEMIHLVGRSQHFRDGVEGGIPS
ncbi:MAG: hypothetical protein ABI434_24095 [Burkholderiaceae bacterium]